jgi:hypothetical protein
MFGMLDYRAHKLLWLLFLPIRICVRLSFFVNVAAAVFLAAMTSYSLLVKIVIAYLIFELIGMVLLAFWTFISWLVRKGFFWVIDVIPADGDNAEEVMAVVLAGKIVRLSKKLSTDVGNVTLEEMDELSRVPNWRAKLLFNARERVGKRLMILFQHHLTTGQQPGTLSPEEMKNLVGHLDFTKFEGTVSSEWFFNSAFGFVLIVVALLCLK